MKHTFRAAYIFLIQECMVKTGQTFLQSIHHIKITGSH